MNGPAANSGMDPTVAAKAERLRAELARLGSALVAFSGGVDSAVLLQVAVRVLGPQKVLAVTGRSPSVPRAELESVAALAAELGAPHEFLDTHEFDDPNYLANPQNRCYFCKTELYTRLLPLARERGYAAVLSGTNADDLGDYRPGLDAAAEQQVRAPLADAGITKAELRAIGAALGLPIHAKPASPCLSSRIPYGEPVTVEKLARIDAAETFLRSLGFAECRVRHHEGGVARIEVLPSELARFADADLRAQVDRRLRELGFAYVALDLRGFRSGSLNEVLVGEGLKGRM
jgi:pyridinium-3,5-biscarboxylic acid mononucleotide sulfurtransferase